jgi:hypothetical protein
MAGAASCGLAASCSLVTSWDGLTSNDTGSSTSSTGSSGGSDGSGGSGGSGGADPVDASASDAAPDAPAVFECTPGEHYCGGGAIKGSTKTLYLCNSDHSTSVLEACAHGCLALPAAKDDICRCLAGGFYCGGDHIEGDPTTLYKCNADGSGTLVKHCTKGCVVMTGKDDACG